MRSASVSKPFKTQQLSDLPNLILLKKVKHFHKILITLAKVTISTI